jgi:hypothetical protein
VKQTWKLKQILKVIDTQMIAIKLQLQLHNNICIKVKYAVAIAITIASRRIIIWNLKLMNQSLEMEDPMLHS